MEEVTANRKFIFRVRYTKKGDLRYISHLDLLRLWERAVRRAGVPVSMSEGFNPKPRFSFPLALELGLTGLDEVMDMRLSEWLRPAEVRERLQRVLPAGLTVTDVRTVHTHSPCTVAYTAYRVPLRPGHGLTEARVGALLASESILCARVRKQRAIEKDIRPFIRNIRLEGDCLEMIFDYTAQGTARPEEVLEALACRRGADYRLSEIVRTRVALVSPN